MKIPHVSERYSWLTINLAIAVWVIVLNPSEWRWPLAIVLVALILSFLP